MIKFFKKLFGSKSEATQPEAAPYKVETPEPSPIVEQATQAAVESIAKPAKAKKPAGAKKASSGQKKPRKPKAPKA